MSDTLKRDIKLNIGWVSTYNTQCGIAAYSKYLISSFNFPVKVLAAHTSTPLDSDSITVDRCWNTGYDSFENLIYHINKYDLNCIVIQYHYGLFDNQSLYRLVTWLIANNKKIILMIHSLGSRINEILDISKLCNLVTVQTDIDRCKLSSLENCIVFQLPVVTQETKNQKIKTDDSILLGSYGFFFPNKGILELIQAVDLLRKQGHNYKLRLVNANHPSEISTNTVLQAKNLVNILELNNYIDFYTDFLDDNKSYDLLTDCDLIVNSYQNTTEPTSASVRFSISTGVPVIITPSSIFEDIKDIVFRIDGFDPLSIAQSIYASISKIKSVNTEYITLINKASEWCNTYSYKLQGPRLLKLIQDV